MIIKVSEQERGWSVWVTEKPGPAEPSIYTATGRTKEQIGALLTAIIPDGQPITVAPQAAVSLEGSEVAQAKREALGAVLEALDSWISGAKSNHEASEHRGENRGEECWRQFAPEDIRTMINDAARDVGVAPFLAPVSPMEDRPWT